MMNLSRQKSSAISCTWAPSCAVLSYCVASRQNTLQLYLGSFLCYLTGFILWNLDNHTCPTLQYIRAALPTFLRPFIQVLLLHISDLFILTHSQGVVFKYSSLLSVTKWKMICQKELPFENELFVMDERIFFLFTFVLTMGISLRGKNTLYLQLTTSSHRQNWGAYCGAVVGGKCMVSKAKFVIYEFAM